MPEATPSLKEDLAALVSGATAPPAAAPATTDTPATAETQVDAGAGEEKTGETKEGDKKAEAAEKPAEQRPNPWSPELQKWTQKQSARYDALQRENAALKAQISKIAKQLGVEDEAPAADTAAKPATETTTAPSGTSEQESDLADLRQKQMLLEVRLQYPNSDPPKMLDESVMETMAILGIPPDAEEMPEGVTAQAFQRVARGIFQKKVAALATAPKTPEPVKKPQPPSKLPPKTPGGAAIGTPPVSHQPSRRAAGGNTPSFAEDCAKLAGQTP